jgi:NTE family protein
MRFNRTFSGSRLGCRLSIVLVISSIGLTACQTAPPAPVTVPAVPAPPAAVVPIVPVPPRIGLALGGGAARGFAHIGVIQVLEEAGIRPDLVVGTSAGSLVAALYATGKSGTELERVARAMDDTSLTDWAFPGRGLIRGEALARFVRVHTGGRSIEQMTLPLGIVATDLDSGEPMLFRLGDTGTAVRASSAVPAIFQPVSIRGHEYVDGGLVSPVPVRFARGMGANVVIAVDISQPPQPGQTGDPFRMLLQTFSIMGKRISHFELNDADVVISPALAAMSGTDFAGRTRAIEAGREAARRALPALRRRLAEAAQ